MKPEIISNRECGECSACCFIGQVHFKEYTKPAHKRCLHVIDKPKKRAGSCGIFGQECRPSECNSFQCSWLRGIGSEKDRPDLSGVMISINNLNGGTWIFIVELEENAILGKGKEIILDIVNKFNIPAIVTSYGTKPPHDTGEKVIVKDSLLSRSKGLIGNKIDNLSENVNIYQLIDSKEI